MSNRKTFVAIAHQARVPGLPRPAGEFDPVSPAAEPLQSPEHPDPGRRTPATADRRTATKEFKPICLEHSGLSLSNISKAGIVNHRGRRKS